MSGKEKQIKFWFWCGRILPLLALAIIGFSLALDLTSWLDYVLLAIGLVFLTFAFTWWWWVLDTVRTLFSLLQSAQDRFTSVIQELAEIKKELKDDNNRERAKSPRNKPK